MTPEDWIATNRTAIELCAAGKAAVQPIIEHQIVHGSSEPFYDGAKVEVRLQTPWQLGQRLDKFVNG